MTPCSFVDIVACRAVAMQRPRDGSFMGNGSVTRSRRNRHERNYRRDVFSVWSVPRCYKQGTRLEASQFCTGVCEERT
jgi:hypothetical protein